MSTNRTSSPDVTPETIRPEHAVELLAEKLRQGPATKRRATTTTRKRGPTKK